MSKAKKYTPLIAIFCIACTIWLSGIHKYVSIDSLKEHQDFLNLYVKHHLVKSLVVFSLVYFLIVSLSIPVATVLSIISGFLFDQVIATICVVLSASFGGCVLFLSTKYASKEITYENKSWVKTMEVGFKKNAFLYMLFLRLTPLFPFTAINIVTGILQLPLKTFFFGTMLGIIPSSSIYVSIGISMRSLLNQEDFALNNLINTNTIISLSGLGILSILPIIYKLSKKRKA